MKFSHCIITAIFSPIKNNWTIASKRKNQLTPLYPHPALFVQIPNAYSWRRTWSQRCFLFWVLKRVRMAGNLHPILINLYVSFLLFLRPDNLFIFWSWQLLRLLIEYNRSLNRHHLSKKWTFLRVTVLPETEIPELFKPVHFRWAFSHRTGSAVGYWVKIHLGIDASVRSQPCSHSPIFMLSDCPLLCSSQLTAMFVPLVQDVLCSCNEQRWYHSQAFPKRQALCWLGTMHAPLLNTLAAFGEVLLSCFTGGETEVWAIQANQ